MFGKKREPQSKDNQIISEIRGLRKDIQSQSRREQFMSTAGRMLGNTYKSAGNIGRSFNTPNSNDRPKIANLPDKQPPICRNTFSRGR